MTQDTFRIGIVVDHPKRDLWGAVLLARALAERGAEAFLVPLYDQGVDVPLLRLDAVVLNFARTVNLPLAQSYAAMGLDVWVLDTEGGVLATEGGNAPPALAAFVKSSGFADLLRGYFFWGEVLHDAFVKGSGLPAERLILSGCPRFDLAAPRWRDLLVSDDRDFILFNTNFSLVNSRFSQSADAEADMMVSAGWSRHYANTLIRDLTRIIDDYIAVVVAVARAFPDQKIKLRPHPFEGDARFIEAFRDIPNIEVDGRGNVLRVIANASCVIHVNCGTALEAVMLDKPPLSLDFVNSDAMRSHCALPNAVSRQIGSVEELITCLRDLPGTTRGFPFAEAREKHVRPWFYKIDGQASERVAEALLKYCRKSRGRIRLSLTLKSSHRHARAAQRFQGVAAAVFGSAPVSRFRAWLKPGRKEKRLHLDEVREMVSSASNVAGVVAPVVRHARNPLTRAPLATLQIGGAA